MVIKNLVCLRVQIGDPGLGLVQVYRLSLGIWGKRSLGFGSWSVQGNNLWHAMFWNLQKSQLAKTNGRYEVQSLKASSHLPKGGSIIETAEDSKLTSSFSDSLIRKYDCTQGLEA